MGPYRTPADVQERRVALCGECRWLWCEEWCDAPGNRGVNWLGRTRIEDPRERNKNNDCPEFCPKRSLWSRIFRRRADA